MDYVRFTSSELRHIISGMKKPGPKPQFGVAMKRKIVTMDEMTLRKAKVIGNGNVSQAVRLAIEREYERYQRSA